MINKFFRCRRQRKSHISFQGIFLFTEEGNVSIQLSDMESYGRAVWMMVSAKGQYTYKNTLAIKGAVQCAGQSIFASVGTLLS